MVRKSPDDERLARFMTAVLADDEAARHWAEACGWLPGSGRCRLEVTRDCTAACLFCAMRQDEAARIAQHRRRRRRIARAFR
jgi:hypothetical protein